MKFLGTLLFGIGSSALFSGAVYLVAPWLERSSALRAATDPDVPILIGHYTSEHAELALNVDGRYTLLFGSSTSESGTWVVRSGKVELRSDSGTTRECDFRFENDAILGVDRFVARIGWLVLQHWAVDVWDELHRSY